MRRHAPRPPLAWPALADFFSFATVLMAALWALDGPVDEPTLRRDLEAARARVAALERENAELRRALNGEADALDRMARERASSLLAQLRASIDPVDVQFGEVDEDAPQFPITRFAGRILTFDTAVPTLGSDDHAVLRRAAALIEPLLAGDEAVSLVVEGSADPRALHSAAHPRDNVELSALRAADTAKAVNEAAPRLSDRLLVVGLGETGSVLPGVLGLDEAYRPYRTVRLSIRIRKDLLAGGR